MQGKTPYLQNARRLNYYARDTFNGAYSSDYLRQKEAEKWDVKQAVIRANRAAALTITRLDAQQGIPWADEIDHFNAPLNERENLKS